MQKRNIMSIYEAEQAPKTEKLLAESIGEISGVFVDVYPPGIPWLVPGELISEKAVAHIIDYKKNDFSIHGLQDTDTKKILVVKK